MITTRVRAAKRRAGFTLVELAIVLVIIGLIIGGVLVGKSLIDAAAIRGQISQIGKYNTAVHVFQTKYDTLPGDMDPTSAVRFGFTARSGVAGRGDGNGVLQGTFGVGAGNYDGVYIFAGETGMFWVDLSTAGFIDGHFNTATINTGLAADIGVASVPLYLPTAKLSGGNFVYVWSNDPAKGNDSTSIAGHQLLRNLIGDRLLQSVYAGGGRGNDRTASRRHRSENG